jgi:hypothetical protein
VDAVEFVDADAQLAGETRACQFRQDFFKMTVVPLPDGVGHDFVKAKAQLSCATAQGDDEFRIQKRLSAGEPQRADAVAVRVLQETQGDSHVEAIGPFDRHAAMRTGQIALVGAGKRQIVGPERAAPTAGAAAQRAIDFAARGWHESLRQGALPFSDCGAFPPLSYFSSLGGPGKHNNKAAEKRRSPKKGEAIKAVYRPWRS